MLVKKEPCCHLLFNGTGALKILKQFYSKAHIRYLKLELYGGWVKQSGHDFQKLPLTPPAARRYSEGSQVPKIITRRCLRVEMTGSGRIMGNRCSPRQSHGHIWPEVSHCCALQCQALCPFSCWLLPFFTESQRAFSAARCINTVTEHREQIHVFLLQWDISRSGRKCAGAQKLVLALRVLQTKSRKVSTVQLHNELLTGSMRVENLLETTRNTVA